MQIFWGAMCGLAIGVVGSVIDRLSPEEAGKLTLLCTVVGVVVGAGIFAFS